jgi:DNA-nicking Smr family endonuclease
MKKTRKASVIPDDVGLFRASLSDVTPLRRTEKVEHELALPQPVPTQRLPDDLETPQDNLADSLTYARKGISPQTLRKLRRGHWVTQAELDLHGMTVAEARERLVEFLDMCARRDLRCVRIIHGKGLRSPNREPVLKGKVARWLMQRDEILAFCQARPADGGSGAMMVLLKGRS